MGRKTLLLIKEADVPILCCTSMLEHKYAGESAYVDNTSQTCIEDYYKAEKNTKNMQCSQSHKLCSAHNSRIMQ